MTCPHCGQELTAAEVKRLWAALGRSIASQAKQAAARENGKKGGRPRKTAPKEEPQ